MLKKVLQMNRSVASPAVPREKTTPAETAPGRCTMPYAQNAEDPAKSLSSRVTTVRFIAETASENK